MLIPGRVVAVGVTSSCCCCSPDCALIESGSAVVEGVGRPRPLAPNPGRGRTMRDGVSDTLESSSLRSVVVVLGVVLTEPLRLNLLRAKKQETHKFNSKYDNYENIRSECKLLLVLKIVKLSTYYAFKI